MYCMYPALRSAVVEQHTQDLRRITE